MNAGAARIAVTTDSHVVKPLVFPGGDIGKLAVCGTVNDLVVSGADALYLTAAFVVEEGFALDDLEAVAASMAAAAADAGVRIVAGDTKVVGKGECDGLFITTTGVGLVPPNRKGVARAAEIAQGDAILVNGPVGDHGAAIACTRNRIETDPPLESDCASLSGLVANLYDAGVVPRFMRDATRGGLATVLCELAQLASIDLEVQEERIPIRDTVRGVCEMYGFDPLYLANEGTMVCVVEAPQAETALDAMRAHRHGSAAAWIGAVGAELRDGGDNTRPRRAVLRTSIGGRRVLRMLAGEQLPRIC
jgi:hydrogenase expression/formation protein HypE